MSKQLKKSEEYSPIFNRLIDLCSEKNTTVSYLLDKFTSSRSAITAWKKGNISANIIEKIASELNVSVEYLVTGKEISAPETIIDQSVVNDNDLKFALFDGVDDITDEMFDEVKQFAQMVKMREDAKRKETK